ncbi:hypothetical protein ASPCADRAFT_202205 [Aspergillus carbonarius ITEM 5010]|uniref:Uncharacterized protein n=1 Tax=Aspergillus carbonarius (strain ITEM 5010) TaxID=602072 RepID=A0A1R3S0V0_ASPC5|nr:hypothetical protein ASPCADRAFT_202205 [Aspergillus carbonarius ITEM 5010]
MATSIRLSNGCSYHPARLITPWLLSYTWLVLVTLKTRGTRESQVGPRWRRPKAPLGLQYLDRSGQEPR